MKYRLLSITVLLSVSMLITAQEADATSSTTKEVIKPFSWMPLPSVGVDPDLGVRYGALVQLYWYGDGSRYPLYNHYVYAEWSRTTKGNGQNRFTYESNELIPGIRSLFEVSYLTEKNLEFFGFNGYQAVYDLDFEKNGTDQFGHVNRLYYRHSRKLLRIKGELQGEILGQKLRWMGGIAYYGISVDSVDIDALNEGKEDTGKDLLSHNSLYGNYVDWGLIPADQASGGRHTILKGGVIYDTRDNEPNPFSGLWTELQLLYAPSFLSNTDYGYARLVLTHRQYFTLIPEWMNLAYRVSYQGKIAGETPFYMLPFMFQSAPKETYDGIGGGKNVRGVKRNRIVGDGFVFANLELRGKVLRTTLLKKSFYIALSAFADAGMVTQKFKFDASGMPGTLPDDLPGQILDLNAKEIPHVGVGGGIHFGWDQNMIVSLDYGYALRKEDGVNKSPYLTLGFLF